MTAIGGTAAGVTVLPFSSVSGKLKAFGRDYTVEVNKDLARATVEIPKSAIPPGLKDGDANLKLDEKGVPKVLEFFDSLNFT